MSTKYYKLAPHAASFSDPLSGVTLSKDKVVAFDPEAEENKDKPTADKNLIKAVTDNHIQEATEEEFNKYEAWVKKATKESDVQMQKAQKTFGVAANTLGIGTEPKLKDSAPPSLDADDDEDEDEWDTLTDAEKRKFLQDSPILLEDKKADLKSLKGKKLDELYEQVKGANPQK
jgi:hypothetical protein